MIDADLPALRVVHLAGGLRARDLGDGKIEVGPSTDLTLLTFPRPAYRELYKALSGMNLDPLGVDFFAHESALKGLTPPDWWAYHRASGFYAMQPEQDWGNVRHVPEQKTPELADFAGRFVTYHRLLSLRLRELSEAYAEALRARLIGVSGGYDGPGEGGLFSNGFLIRIEAAIHGFLTDAAGFRDLIAEAVWRLVLREPSTDVTTLASLLKKSRTRTESVLPGIRAAAADGGWLKSFTDLRNAIIHVAPLANAQELHLIDLRLRPLQGGVLPYIHYPLTTASGGLRARPARVDFTDETAARQQLEAYREFVAESGDALSYAAVTLNRLVRLAAEVRLSAGLKSQMLHLTDRDIISFKRMS